MHTQPQSDSQDVLQSLLSYLEKEYYTRLETLCERADLHIAELHNGDVHQTASLYTSLSKKLIGQIAQYIRLRRFGFLPYIHELMDKEDSGHDCRACSSSCTIRHTAHISGIKEAHTKIKETLYRLQSVATPIYHESLHDLTYRLLRAEMMQLDTALTELFYLEESSLIPKVMEAQKAIHAHS